MASCDGLVGLSEEELIQRLGQPSARRDVGSDTWAVFQSKPMMIRIRLAGADPRRVASWTVSFDTGFQRLSEAAGAVGLWPAAGPEEDAARVTTPLVRRPLPCPDSDRVYSFTATVRQGLFTALSVFDEAPDWI
ncbi:MAG: hypothetical protein M8861_06370 [marine benthic group bacterium]|nr:hypothetical protein [Gemmatimonadota bacterium]